MDEKILKAAFLPFGEVTDVQIPMDFEKRTLAGVVGRVDESE